MNRPMVVLQARTAPCAGDALCKLYVEANSDGSINPEVLLQSFAKCGAFLLRNIPAGNLALTEEFKDETAPLFRVIRVSNKETGEPLFWLHRWSFTPADSGCCLYCQKKDVCFAAPKNYRQKQIGDVRFCFSLDEVGSLAEQMRRISPKNTADDFVYGSNDQLFVLKNKKTDYEMSVFAIHERDLWTGHAALSSTLREEDWEIIGRMDAVPRNLPRQCLEKLARDAVRFAKDG